MKRYSKSQAREIKKMIQDKLDAGMNFAEITDFFNTNGIKPANNEKWTISSFSQFANKRKIYMYKNAQRQKTFTYPKPEIQPSNDTPALRTLILDAKIDAETKIRMLKTLESQ